MKNIFIISCFLIGGGCANISSLHAQQKNDNITWYASPSLEQLAVAPVALIPYPQKVSWGTSKWIIPKTVRLTFYNTRENDSGSNAIRSLQQLLGEYDIVIKHDNNGSQIHLSINKHPGIAKEGYRLTVSRKGLVIEATDAAGLYYGVQTFRQLLKKTHKQVEVPGCTIIDWPAFGLRGFMHDNGRNFQSIAMLESQLEILSRYKYNIFHWHLTDNPAWRPQSRIYPQLNEARNRQEGRDPDSSYSFDDIRELIRFAKQRHIKIIPELDMPGHSKYFGATFGFKMESEKGMQVLEKLIDEFCREIPVEDCPVLHIGSDEVHIPNQKEFIGRMTAKVLANGRKPMVWNPGLPPVPGTIQQVWYDGITHATKRDSTQPYVDSYSGYLNADDAQTLIQRYFFNQICAKPSGDSLALGGILCCWPDARIDDKRKIFLHNPVWPGVVTYSEAVWQGRPGFDYQWMSTLPSQGSVGGMYFKEFEKRLASHRDKFFKALDFPYVQFGRHQWNLYGPVVYNTPFSPDKTPYAEIEKYFSHIEKVSTITGGALKIKDLTGKKSIPDSVAQTVYLQAYIYSRVAQNMHALIGFESAARSNRQSAGLPSNGEWDANGGVIYINGEKLAGPAWKKPGAHRYLKPTWHHPANEIPYDDEEFYWSRPPASIKLKKGWNKVIVSVPRSYSDQYWSFTMLPVKKNTGNKWVEDLTISLQNDLVQ